MIIQPVPLSHLVASDQPRPLLTAEVDKLANSIKEIGLIQPITVTPTTVFHGLAEPGWRIVAGHHRVAAVRALGWKEIDAIVIDNAKNLQNELIEIDENLCRAELTTAQRRLLTKRREQIWGALHPAPVAPKPKPFKTSLRRGRSLRKRIEDLENATNTEVAQAAPPQYAGKLGGARPQTKGFAADTASATGQSKATTNRALASANALGLDTLAKVTNTSLDSGVELDALAKLDAPARAELIERAVAGEKVSAKPAATAAQTIPRHPSIATAIRTALRAVLDDFGCMAVRDLLPIIKEQDAQDEVQEVFESWYAAVYPVDVLALA